MNTERETLAGNGTNDTMPAIPEAPVHQAQFTGRAGEYFRIWIVNLVLSIITLGIYSAWATVRTRRYFMGNTDIDGQRFDFHGAPLAILKGRAVAVLVFLAYGFGTEFHIGITLAAFAIIAISFPWVLVRALRFRLANTSYRGLRFAFRGTTAEAYRLLGPILLLGAVVFAFYLVTFNSIDIEDPEAIAQNYLVLGASFGLTVLVNLSLLPVLWFRIRNFSTNNSCFGRHGFRAAIRLGVFWKAMFAALGLGLAATAAVIAVMAALGALAMGKGAESYQFIIFMAVTYALLIVAYLAPFAAWYCIINNHVANNTRLDELALELRLEGILYWWILASNAFAAILTLGMAIPWAKVRMTRYKLSCLSLRGDLDGFMGDTEQDPGALGDELGQAFDFDFGF